jgi:hypothetical protein
MWSTTCYKFKSIFQIQLSTPKVKSQKIISCQSKQSLYKLHNSNLFGCLYLIQCIQSTHGCQMVMKNLIKFKQSK